MFHVKTKLLEFRTKIALFRYFWAGIWKIHCHIWNQHLRIFRKAIFREKRKNFSFRTKDVFFEYIWDGIWKYYCHNWNEPPGIGLISNLRAWMQMSVFGAKNTLLGFFLGRNLSQHPRICLKWTNNSYS